MRKKKKKATTVEGDRHTLSMRLYRAKEGIKMSIWWNKASQGRDQTA